MNHLPGYTGASARDTNLQEDDQSSTNSSSAQFNAALFVNSPDFDLSSTVVFDPEHFTRIPTGGSVIDMSAVYDDSGRSFHGYKEGKYFGPNDPVLIATSLFEDCANVLQAEQDRLDLQHAGLLLLMDGKLHWAPILNPKYALDIATGTGIWATQFAEQNPSCQVIGTDLSAIQPTPRVPNCSFVVEDSEEEWVFISTDEPIQFDYVHLRAVASCFDDPRKVMKQAYNNLRPGGWIEYLDLIFEFQNVDGKFTGRPYFKPGVGLFVDSLDCGIKRWADFMIEGMAQNGRDALVVKHYKAWLEEEGFVDVVERRLIVPGNPWPSHERMKKVGYYMLENVCDGFRGMGWKMLKHLGLSMDEIEQLVLDAKSDATNPNNRWFCPWYVVYGRKPYEGESNTSGAQFV